MPLCTDAACFGRSVPVLSQRSRDTDLLTIEKENIPFLLITLSRDESFEDLNTRTRGVRKPEHPTGVAALWEGILITAY